MLSSPFQSFLQGSAPAIISFLAPSRLFTMQAWCNNVCPFFRSIKISLFNQNLIYNLIYRVIAFIHIIRPIKFKSCLIAPFLSFHCLFCWMLRVINFLLIIAFLFKEWLHFLLIRFFPFLKVRNPFLGLMFHG